ncbi:MAG TPA: hypothetical protein VLK30_14575 [Candidatus Limnocylindrales bacterium]|nr:hypothetical protein [Candidatus Limnocylindrales bacterium]
MSTIRIEAGGAVDLSRAYLWLSRHRGQFIELDPERRVTLGVPISGARAVIVAAVLGNGVGGVLRALSNPKDRAVRVVFDVRSRGGLDVDQVQALGAEVVEAISKQIAGEDLVAQVA